MPTGLPITSPAIMPMPIVLLSAFEYYAEIMMAVFAIAKRGRIKKFTAL